ncbi:hypothetical protein AAHA92_14217 [Salvia divinorum]|uniref:Uncharacterized protein n=1 Tax=Salvia divinorum TaxID=28513 RepID=A0ABD1HAT5_SALDI
MASESNSSENEDLRRSIYSGRVFHCADMGKNGLVMNQVRNVELLCFGKPYPVYATEVGGGFEFDDYGEEEEIARSPFDEEVAEFPAWLSDDESGLEKHVCC